MTTDDPYRLERIFPSASGVQLFSHTIEADTARFTFSLDQDCAWFSGHFPGNSVLPGVVQLHCAIQLGQQIFKELQHPSRVTQVKFKEMILPNTLVELKLDFNADKSVLKYCYQYPEQHTNQSQQSNQSFSVGNIRF